MTQPNRPLEIAAFLDRHGWGEASMQPFDGDFSPRRYARLTRADSTTAILMDADVNQKTDAFVAIDGLLRACGTQVPDIYAAEPTQGLVLMQDFGTRNIGALIDNGGAAKPFFLRAAEVLANLHNRFTRTDAAADLPLFSASLFAQQAELLLDGYFPLMQKRDASGEERANFRAAWDAVLRPLDGTAKSLMLRDFMPDNLMDLADGGIGVLDFQDSGIGPVAYDLASLCEEVRRDGGFALLPDIVAHYREHAPNAPSQADLLRACTILSAQRHTRILGIVAQLAIKTGRREKLSLLPRIRRHLQHVLGNPYLLPVREWMERYHVD